MGKRNDDEQYAERLAELSELLGEPSFIQKCSYGMTMLETWVAEYNKRFEQLHGRSAVDSVSSRIKSAESVAGKLERKGYEISYTNAVHRLNDLAGIRVVCSFRDDVYSMADYLMQCPKLKIVKVKDYIKKPKSSGYQSIHLIVDVDYPLGWDGETVRVEIQIRTVAMNYWAKLDHQLCYKAGEKRSGEIAGIRQELRRYAEEIAKIDQKMLVLRKKIEALDNGQKSTTLQETYKSITQT